MTSPCKFFVRGDCKRGASCSYAHGNSLTNHPPLQHSQLRGEAALFNPGPAPVTERPIIPLDPQTTKKPICLFFLQKRCKNGSLCRFSHDVAVEQHAIAAVSNTVQPSRISYDTTTDKIATQLNNTLSLSQERRTLRGADVIFKDGAEVSAVHPTIPSPVSSERYQLSTVSCSWYKPSKGAWLHYGSRQAALLAITKFGDTCKIKGRVVQAQMGPAPHPRIHNPIWSVVLGNLSISTSKNDLIAALQGVLPNQIVFGKYSHPMSETEVCSLVKDRLEEYGPLASFETSHGLNASRMKALARFTNAADAQAAASQLSGKNLTMSGSRGSIKLFVNLTASVKFLVLGALYEIIRGDIQKTQSASESVRINAYLPDRDGKPVVIRIIGQDLRAVSKAKALFENLIKGDVILNDDGSPCWDDYFVSAAGLDYIKALSLPGIVFVYRDVRKRQVVMHGSSQAFEGTRQAVLAKLIELSEMVHTLPLTRELLSRAFKGAFRSMIDTLGPEVVKLDVTTMPPSIVVRGNTSVFARAQSLLLAPLQEQGLPVQKSSSDAECPVCMMDPEDAVSLKCEHSYCKDCFESQCRAAQSSTIPLRCFGEYAKCGRIIALQDLKGNLARKAFEDLLSASFDTYLQMHPNQYQYCPSPDCPMVYAVTTDGTTKSCPACLTMICTSCQAVDHDGITCEDSRYIVSDDNKAYLAWKRDHDARDCPNCKTAIEKTYGCNHMECGGCKAHICWFCMEVFKVSKQCYDHMHDKHGGFYQGREGL